MIDTHSHDIHTHTCLHKHALMYIHNTRQRQTARTPEKSLPALAGIHPQPQTQRCCQCTVYQCVVPPHTTHKVTGKHTHTHTCTHTHTHTHTHTRTHTCTHTHTRLIIYMHACECTSTHFACTQDRVTLHAPQRSYRLTWLGHTRSHKRGDAVCRASPHHTGGR